MPTVTLIASILIIAGMGIWTTLRIRDVSAFLYPIVTIFLGINFVIGFMLGLLRGGPENRWRRHQIDESTINYSQQIEY
jgi:hypothetical protein